MLVLSSFLDFPASRRGCVNPFRTAVPFWGQSILILGSLSPKRDWGSKVFFQGCLLSLRGAEGRRVVFSGRRVRKKSYIFFYYFPFFFGIYFLRDHTLVKSVVLS